MNHMLPSGKGTNKTRVYIDEWRKLTAAVEAALPGWVCYGFDPGVALYRRGGQWHFIDLPVSAAQRIAYLGARVAELEREKGEGDG